MDVSLMNTRLATIAVGVVLTLPIVAGVISFWVGCSARARHSKCGSSQPSFEFREIAGPTSLAMLGFFPLVIVFAWVSMADLADAADFPVLWLVVVLLTFVTVPIWLGMSWVVYWFMIPE